MTDTPAEIERLVRDKIMARSAEERFVMGAQMFESAREMVLGVAATRFVGGGTAAAIVQTFLWGRT